MATSDIIHIRPLLDELSRICETDLKAPLSLKSVIQGELAFQAADSITNMVNGIWVHPTPGMVSNPDEIPKRLLQQYNFRFVYLRKIEIGQNPLDQILDDVALIVNTFTDNYHLQSIAGLPAHAQVLWANVGGVEFQPPEDEYVARIYADIKAIAFQMTVFVRTRRA